MNLFNCIIYLKEISPPKGELILECLFIGYC